MTVMTQYDYLKICTTKLCSPRSYGELSSEPTTAARLTARRLKLGGKLDFMGFSFGGKYDDSLDPHGSSIAVILKQRSFCRFVYTPPSDRPWRSEKKRAASAGSRSTFTIVCCSCILITYSIQFNSTQSTVQLVRVTSTGSWLVVWGGALLPVLKTTQESQEARN